MRKLFQTQDLSQAQQDSNLKCTKKVCIERKAHKINDLGLDIIGRDKKYFVLIKNNIYKQEELCNGRENKKI